MAQDTPDRTCRFCGLVMDDELGDASFHPTCVDAPVDDDDRPKPSGAHPFFGKRPGPLVQPG